jgi:hypothetical protein
MAGVIPAWKILEVINTEQFVNERKEEAEQAPELEALHSQGAV